MTETAMRAALAVVLLGSLAVAVPAAAQVGNAAALAELDARLPGELINDPSSLDWATQGDGLKVTAVSDATIPGGGAAARYNVRTPGPDPWSVQAYVPLTAPVAKGEVVTFGFWGRAATVPAGRTAGQVSVRIQENLDPGPASATPS